MTDADEPEAPTRLRRNETRVCIQKKNISTGKVETSYLYLSLDTMFPSRPHGLDQEPIKKFRRQWRLDPSIGEFTDNGYRYRWFTPVSGQSPKWPGDEKGKDA